MGPVGKGNTNYGMMRFTKVHSGKTEKAGNGDSSASKVNFAPVKLANTEVKMATTSTSTSPLASPSWKSSIATDSARREKSGMAKVTQMVANYESKGNISETRADKQISVGRAPTDSATVSSLAAKFSSNSD